jgi:hypothetical protein
VQLEGRLCDGASDWFRLRAPCTSWLGVETRTVDDEGGDGTESFDSSLRLGCAVAKLFTDALASSADEKAAAHVRVLEAVGRMLLEPGDALGRRARKGAGGRLGIVAEGRATAGHILDAAVDQLGGSAERTGRACIGARAERITVAASAGLAGITEPAAAARRRARYAEERAPFPPCQHRLDVRARTSRCTVLGQRVARGEA